MQANSKLVGSYLIRELAKLREEFECVGDVRGKGLMIGVELVRDKITKQPLTGDPFFDIWERCRDMGLLIGRGGSKGNVRQIACTAFHILRVSDSYGSPIANRH